MAIPLRDNAPHYDTPYITMCIMLVNAFVFILQLLSPGGPQAVINLWGLQPARIWDGGVVPGTDIPAWVALFTSTYLHFDIFHIAGNMLILWIVGNSLEWLCGRARFFLLYSLCGLGAAYATALLGGHSTMAGAGASGAIAGVMGAYLLMFPRAKVTSLLWIPPFSFMHFATGTWGIVYRNISVLWFVGGWVLIQAISALAIVSLTQESGPYGVYAHLAGAACGAGLIWLARIPARMPPDDHPCRSGELTAIIIGDEGDAGDGQAEMTPDMLHEQWLHTPEGRLQQRILELRAPFEDRFADQLIEQGDYAGARAHCEQMLELAQRDMNEARVEGYTRLLTTVRQRLAQTQQQELAQRRSQPSLPQGRVYEGAGGAEIRERGGLAPRKPDPFNLGDAPRGSRRR